MKSEGEVLGRKELFAVIGLTEVAFEPLHIGTAGCFAGFGVPAGSGTFLHSFAVVGSEEDQFLSALGAVLIQFLGATIDPLDIIATSGFLGFFVPTAGATFFHFFTEAGDLQD